MILPFFWPRDAKNAVIEVVLKLLLLWIKRDSSVIQTLFKGDFPWPTFNRFFSRSQIERKGVSVLFFFPKDKLRQAANLSCHQKEKGLSYLRVFTVLKKTSADWHVTNAVAWVIFRWSSIKGIIKTFFSPRDSSHDARQLYFGAARHKIRNSGLITKDLMSSLANFGVKIHTNFFFD